MNAQIKTDSIDFGGFPNSGITGFTDEDIVYTYTRADAIADGVLVSLSDLFPELCKQLYKYPIAVTEAIWSIIEGTDKDDIEGIVWDILWMSQKGITARIDDSQHLFEVFIADKGKAKSHTFKAVCHPDDDMKPVITIMMRNED